MPQVMSLDELMNTEAIYLEGFDVRKAATDVGPISQEEAKEWKEAYETNAGFSLGPAYTTRTAPPTKEEVKGWQEAYEFFSNMDFEAVKKKYNVTFEQRELAPYEIEDWAEWTAKIGIKEKKKREDVSLIGKMIAKAKRIIRLL